MYPYIVGSVGGDLRRYSQATESRARHLTSPPPNPSLNSDPACCAFRSLSASRFLDSAQRLGADVAG